MTATDTQHSRAAPPSAHAAPSAYEMLPLETAAQRAEGRALVEDRLRWLERRGISDPANHEIPARFQGDRAESVGLYEDGTLLGCLILNRQPALGHWGVHGGGRSLFLDHVHTHPERSEGVVRLITLWASDHAARLGLRFVRAEVPARHDHYTDPLARFLVRITDMGWEIRGSGHGIRGGRIVRLELIAEPHPGLTPLIRSSVPVPLDPSRSTP